MNPDEDSDLSRLLRKWEEDARVPNRFQTSVWSRIAAREGKYGRFGDGLSVFFARPACAAAAASVALVVTISLAHTHATRVTDSRRSVAEASYLASISPLLRMSDGGSILTNSHGHE